MIRKRLGSPCLSSKSSDSLRLTAALALPSAYPGYTIRFPAKPVETSKINQSATCTQAAQNNLNQTASFLYPNSRTPQQGLTLSSLAKADYQFSVSCSVDCKPLILL